MSAIVRAWIGTAVWAGFVFFRVSSLGGDAWAYALLLFAALVLVPLALELFVDEEESPLAMRWFAWANSVQLPAAMLLTLAYWMPPGKLATAAAVPWVALTFLLSAIGFLRLKRGGLRRPLDGMCADAALIFAAIGGAWTLADRLAYSPLGFDAAIVMLTAVHFHYAGLLLPLFAGLVQRELFFWRLSSRAAVGVVLGVPAVAIGITTTRLGWGPNLEAAAGCGLALAGMAVGILQVRIATDGKQTLRTRTLLALAGVSLFIAMVLAAVYALRSSGASFPWLGIPQMRMLHGTINALGFGLCGVLAWRRMARERPARS
jgi:hypothetical protein